MELTDIAMIVSILNGVVALVLAVDELLARRRRRSQDLRPRSRCSS
jgi:hypothetical protein